MKKALSSTPNISKQKARGHPTVPDPSQNVSFATTMRNMERALPANPYMFPNTVVHSVSFDGAGSTFANKHEAGETALSRVESGPEVDLVKAILNREGYLNKLAACVKTVNKKFKPEVAELLDLVRAASMDVIERLLEWREVKKDHDAAFMWNGMNYLLKMPSDLDYLSSYRAINKYLGFPIKRNPFAIPEPMDLGIMNFVGECSFLLIVPM